MAASSWFSTFVKQFPSTLAQAEQRMGTAGGNSFWGEQVAGGGLQKPALVQEHKAFALQILQRANQRGSSTNLNAGGNLSLAQPMKLDTFKNRAPDFAVSDQSPEIQQMFAKLFSTLGAFLAYFQQSAKTPSMPENNPSQTSNSMTGMNRGNGAKLGAAGLLGVDAMIQRTLANIGNMMPMAKL